MEGTLHASVACLRGKSMKRKNKDMVRNICAILACMVAIIGVVLACYTRIKYIDYSSWYIMKHYFNETIPTYVCVAISRILLKVSDIFDK